MNNLPPNYLIQKGINDTKDNKIKTFTAKKACLFRDRLLAFSLRQTFWRKLLDSNQ